MNIKLGKMQFVALFKGGSFTLGFSRQASRTMLQFAVGVTGNPGNSNSLKLMAYATSGVHEDATFQSAIFTVFDKSHSRRFRIDLSGRCPVRSAQIIRARS